MVHAYALHIFYVIGKPLFDTNLIYTIRAVSSSIISEVRRSRIYTMSYTTFHRDFLGTSYFLATVEHVIVSFITGNHCYSMFKFDQSFLFCFDWLGKETGSNLEKEKNNITSFLFCFDWLGKETGSNLEKEKNNFFLKKQ